MPATVEFHVGDVGTQLVVSMDDDVSTATITQIKLKKPGRDGSTVVKTAALDGDGSDGLIVYVTEASVLDTEGWWTIQGYVELADGSSWNSDKFSFRVEDNQ